MPKFVTAHSCQAVALLALACFTAWGVPAQAADKLAEVQLPVPGEAGDWRAQLARAENMRKLAKEERRKAEAERAQRDAACQKAFFVNPCLSASRDKWLERIGPVRGADIEANRLEREARAAELAEEERMRLANPPAPGGVVVQSEGVRQSHSLRAAPEAAKPEAPKPEPASPQPTAKPIDPAAAARAEQEGRQQREAAAAAAAERARKARSDAAVYAERARLAAERRAKKSGQSAPAPGSSSAPAAASK